MTARARHRGLWDEQDEFYLRRAASCPDGEAIPLRVRSLVGLIPLFAVEVLRSRPMRPKLPEFAQRLRWFLEHRPDLAGLVSHWNVPGMERDGTALAAARPPR